MYCLQKREPLPSGEDRLLRQVTTVALTVTQGAAAVAGSIWGLAAPMANAGNDGAAHWKT